MVSFKLQFNAPPCNFKVLHVSWNAKYQNVIEALFMNLSKGKSVDPS